MANTFTHGNEHHYFVFTNVESFNDDIRAGKMVPAKIEVYTLAPWPTYKGEFITTFGSYFSAFEGDLMKRFFECCNEWTDTVNRMIGEGKW